MQVHRRKSQKVGMLALFATSLVEFQRQDQLYALTKRHLYCLAYIVQV